MGKPLPPPYVKQSYDTKLTKGVEEAKKMIAAKRCVHCAGAYTFHVLVPWTNLITNSAEEETQQLIADTLKTYSNPKDVLFYIERFTNVINDARTVSCIPHNCHPSWVPLDSTYQWPNAAFC